MTAAIKTPNAPTPPRSSAAGGLEKVVEPEDPELPPAAGGRPDVDGAGFDGGTEEALAPALPAVPGVAGFDPALVAELAVEEAAAAPAPVAVEDVDPGLGEL